MGDAQTDKHLEVKKLVIIGDGAIGRLKFQSFHRREIPWFGKKKQSKGNTHLLQWEIINSVLFFSDKTCLLQVFFNQNFLDFHFSGKTCLLQVFHDGKFPEGYEPTIFHNDSKKMKHPVDEGKEFNMQLWDTAGQVKMRNFPDLFSSVGVLKGIYNYR